MKKIILVGALCFLVSAAQAYTRSYSQPTTYYNYEQSKTYTTHGQQTTPAVYNPKYKEEEPYRHISDTFFMPKQGEIVIDLIGELNNFKPDTGSSTKYYYPQGRLTIGFADWLEIGGGIAYYYAKDKDASGERIEDFDNPYAYGRIRIVNRVFKADFWAKVTFDAFDNDVASQTQKFEGGFILGANYERLSFGGKIGGGYWYRGQEIVNQEENGMVVLNTEGFIDLRPLKFLNLGGKIGVNAYSIDDDDYDYYEYYFGLSADICIINGHLAVGAFYNFKTMSYDEAPISEYDNHNYGIRFKAAF